jgi:hypothetical protein
VSAVKHLIEAAHLEGGDKLASSLLPVWDAVKALQVSRWAGGRTTPRP